MPGYVAPASWGKTPEKVIVQREELAGNLLFRRGLQACGQAAMSVFVKSLGTASAGTAVQAKPKLSRGGIRTPLIDPSLLAAAPKRQSSMDTFLKQTAFIEDGRLAREMRAVKRAGNKSTKNTE
jgi:hypothetical protein